MKKTTVATPAKAQTSAPLYTPVEARVFYDPVTGPIIAVQKKYREKATNGAVDPANIQLGKGHWEVIFRLEPDSGLSFCPGPVLIGIEEPQEHASAEFTFVVIKTTSEVRILRFEFPTDNGPTFQYMVRVFEASGAKHLIDPKVINRGDPTPPTPPLVKD